MVLRSQCVVLCTVCKFVSDGVGYIYIYIYNDSSAQIVAAHRVGNSCIRQYNKTQYMAFYVMQECGKLVIINFKATRLKP